MAKVKAEELAYAQAAEREMAVHLPSIEDQTLARVPSVSSDEPDRDEKFVVIDEVRATPNEEHSLPRNESTAIKTSEPYRPPPPLDGHTQTGQESEWCFQVPQQPNRDPATGGSEQNVAAPPASHASDIQLFLRQQQEAIMALTLPQPDVPIFKGDPIEYCDFIRAFESLIESKTSSPSTRLYYLLQYTSSQVQDLVRSCLAMKKIKATEKPEPYWLNGTASRTKLHRRMLTA